MDCSLPGFSGYGIFQARILEWVAISFSRGTSWLRDRTRVPCVSRQILTTEPPGKPFTVIWQTAKRTPGWRPWQGHRAVLQAEAAGWASAPRSPAALRPVPHHLLCPGPRGWSSLLPELLQLLSRRRGWGRDGQSRGWLFLVLFISACLTAQPVPPAAGESTTIPSGPPPLRQYHSCFCSFTQLGPLEAGQSGACLTAAGPPDGGEPRSKCWVILLVGPVSRQLCLTFDYQFPGGKVLSPSLSTHIFLSILYEHPWALMSKPFWNDHKEWLDVPTAMGSLTKLVDVMEFQLSYFKSWKMMLWKCCTQ